MQIIDTFADSVMSVCLTKTEIIGGSVDGTVRTFDIRIGRFLSALTSRPLFVLFCNSCSKQLIKYFLLDC